MFLSAIYLTFRFESTTFKLIFKSPIFKSFDNVFDFIARLPSAPTAVELAAAPTDTADFGDDTGSSSSSTSSTPSDNSK